MKLKLNAVSIELLNGYIVKIFKTSTVVFSSSDLSFEQKDMSDYQRCSLTFYLSKNEIDLVLFFMLKC